MTGNRANAERFICENPGAGSFLLIASYLSDGALKGLGTSSTGRSYNFTDTKVEADSSYEYEIQSILTAFFKAFN